MKKTIITLLFLSALAQAQYKNQRLKVSDNKHFLVHEDGSPFFWLGDTGWELFHRLDRSEAELYLQNRKELGFNVIQAVLLTERGPLNSPNSYNDRPLTSTTGIFLPQTTLGEKFEDSVAYDYWNHVEYILSLAEKKGLFVAVLPCWGDYVTPRFRDVIIFDDTAKGYNYGHFLGDKFKHHKNIVWVLGGDRLPDENNSGIAVWRSMAEGITDATNGEKNQNNKANYQSTCMSYHCYYPSSIWFENDEWIDFHMWGSYHEKRDLDRSFEIPCYQWQLKNKKPTLNAEPPYELSGINYDVEGKFGYFDDFDARQQAYWSVFAGAMGHTYGCHLVWSFYNTTYDKPDASLNGQTWKSQLNAAGAMQMKFLKQLIESKTFFDRVPAQDIIALNRHDPTGHLQATSGFNYAFVYIPTGKITKIVMGKINGKNVKAQWYNPKNGKYQKIGDYENKGMIEFNPPGEEMRGNDWVLVLDAY